MDAKEILVDSYRDSLRLAHRSLYVGLLIAAVAFGLLATPGEREAHKVPVIGIEMSSPTSFTVALLILYVSCGSVCWFASNRARVIFERIDDKEVSHAIKYFPSLLNSSVALKMAIVVFSGIAWGAPLGTVVDLRWYFGVPIAMFVSAPYWIAFGITDKLIPRR